MLQRHAQIARLVIGVEKLFWSVDLVDVLPPATRVRLQESREPDILKHFFPIQRIDQVPHRQIGRIRRMFVMRQDHRRRNRHAHLVRHRVVEKLVVSRPPERIVHDNRSLQHRVLQIRAIERNVLRDAIQDHRIFLRLIHPDPANLDELRLHSRHLHRVNLFHQRRRKGIFHPKKDSDFLHSTLPILLANS